MKLISLELNDDFRSLKSGFRVDFLSEFDDVDTKEFNPYCIVGRNGSGKSNILEVLGSIFYHLEVEYLKFLPKQQYLNENEEVEYEEMEIFSSLSTSPNAYKLQYYISPTFDKGSYTHVTITKEKDQKAKVNINKDYDNDLGASEAKEYLPQHIIGYSSGENEILSLPFLRMRMIQYEEYINYLEQDIQYLAIESRMIYLDDSFSQAIFISNFLFPQPIIQEVFGETIGVKGVKEFRMVIDLGSKIQNLAGDKLKIKKGILTKIQKLKNCATLYYKDSDTKQLTLDFYVDDACRKAFKKEFGERLELFKFFQQLITMNYYRIDEKTRKKLYTTNSPYAKGFIPEASWDDRFFTFKHFKIEKTGVDELILTRQLSDGEHQFMHSIGLALLYKNTSSLFLLDEPETHFNPAWRAKYISTLRDCFDGDEVSPEVLITSHSPFIVSDSKRENVLVFEKDEKNIVECHRPDFNTFGASVNKITMEVFEKIDTIGDYANNRFDIFRKRFEEGENIDTLIKEIDSTFGDSMEKILFIKNLLHKKANK